MKKWKNGGIASYTAFSCQSPSFVPRVFSFLSFDIKQQVITLTHSLLSVLWWLPANHLPSYPPLSVIPCHSPIIYFSTSSHFFHFQFFAQVPSAHNPIPIFEFKCHSYRFTYIAVVLCSWKFHKRCIVRYHPTLRVNPEASPNCQDSL